ncbi:MAG: hypothetical protein WD316_00360 [Phycisphaeraceae bacterium]
MPDPTNSSHSPLAPVPSDAEADAPRIDGPPAMGTARTHPADAALSDQAMPLRFWLGLIIFVGIALRVIVLILGSAWQIDRAANPETPRDLELASAIIAGKGLSHPHAIDALAAPQLLTHDRLLLNLQLTGARDTAPELNHMPGYPTLLALLDLLHIPLQGLLFVQVALAGLLIGLTFAVTRQLLGSEKAGLLAAAAVAVHPWAIVSSTGLGTELIFALLVVAGLWAVTAVSARPFSAAGGGGLLMGLATLVRPLGLLVGPIAAACVLFREPRKGRAVVLAGIILVISLAPAALWVVRNDLRSGERVLTHAGTIRAYFDTTATLSHPASSGVSPAETLLNAQEPGESLYGTMARITRREAAERPADYFHVAGQRAATRLSDHGVDRLYGQLGLTYRPTGLRNAVLHHAPPVAPAHGWADAATHSLAAGWMSFNLLLAGLALAGLAALALRRRWTALFTLVALGLWLTFAWPLPTHDGRLALIAVQAAAIGALLLPAVQRVKKPRKKRKRKDRWMTDDEADDPAASSVLHKTSMRPV